MAIGKRGSTGRGKRTRQRAENGSSAHNGPEKVSFDGGPVGYKRPPADTQFKKGQPRPKGSGRQKDRKNNQTIAREVFERKVTVKRNGKEQKVSKLEALLERQVNIGLTSDKSVDTLRAISLALRLMSDLEKSDVMKVETIPGDETI